MENIKETKFQTLTKEEMSDIAGGWKLFGSESTPVAGSNYSLADCERDCCKQDYVKTTYFLGIKVKTTYEYDKPCSYGPVNGNKAECQACVLR